MINPSLKPLTFSVTLLSQELATTIFLSAGIVGVRTIASRALMERLCVPPSRNDVVYPLSLPLCRRFQRLAKAAGIAVVGQIRMRPPAKGKFKFRFKQKASANSAEAEEEQLVDVDECGVCYDQEGQVIGSVDNGDSEIIGSNVATVSTFTAGAVPAETLVTGNQCSSTDVVKPVDETDFNVLSADFQSSLSSSFSAEIHQSTPYDSDSDSSGMPSLGDGSSSETRCETAKEVSFARSEGEVRRFSAPAKRGESEDEEGEARKQNREWFQT